jgi:peptidoglycan/LPS O-acetylase OafA/YrhL
MDNVSFDLSTWLAQLFFNLTLTQSFIPIKYIYFSFNSPSWSISNELFFYLLFPFLIIWGLKIKNHRYKKPLLAILVLLIPLLMLVIPADYYKALFYVNPFFRVFDFIIGIMLFEIYLEIKKQSRAINYDLLEISSIILLVVFFIFHTSVPLVMRYSIYYWIPMSLIILVFSFQKGVISSFLSNKTLIFLGEISFGFYMFHQLVLKYFIDFNQHHFHIKNEYVIILIMFALSLIISYISFIWFEKPLNKYLKTILTTKGESQKSL